MHTYLLGMGFTSSTADPCVYNLGEEVLLLLYVDDILPSGVWLSDSDSEQVLNVIEKLKDRFGTVDLEDAMFPSGTGIHRYVNAGTTN